MQITNWLLHTSWKQGYLYQVEPTCKICSATAETRQHFMADCSVFETERDFFNRFKLTQKFREKWLLPLEKNREMFYETREKSD